MFAPPPLPRNLAACLRDLSSQKASARASAVRDLVRHASRDEAVRKDAIPRLAAALGDEAGEVRAAAAVALGDLSASEALSALLVAIEDPDAYVRQMAINALGEIGDGRAASRLLRALTDDRPEVRYQAIIAFPRVAGDDAEGVTSALRRALGDADDSVRYIALRIAEERDMKDAELVRLAKPLLSDAELHVALVAAIFLAKAGEAEGRELILKVARGEVRGMKGAAREDESEAILVAGALGMTDAVPALERRAFGLTRFVADTCAWSAKTALARMGHARAVAEILRDLGSSKRETVEGAVVAAGRARIRAAEDRLRALGPGEADPELVREALEALAAAAPPA